VVKIRSGPSGKTRKAKATFRFSATGGAVRGFQCRLDGAKWRNCRSPKTVKVKRGKHVFRVRGIATGGGFTNVAKRKFKRIG